MHIGVITLFFEGGGSVEEDAIFGYENSPVGLAVTRHRLIQHCNLSFAQMFGYEREELAGTSIAMLYPTTKEFIDVGAFGLKEMSKTSQYNDNRIMQRRDGKQFWCQVHGKSDTPLDPYAHCVWSFTDLSIRRPVVKLTRREREIAMFVVEGLTNKQIAQHLGISHRTVEAHRSRMMNKLGAKTSAELFAMLAGLPPA